jgi:hypothetical protein
MRVVRVRLWKFGNRPFLPHIHHSYYDCNVLDFQDLLAFSLDSLGVFLFSRCKVLWMLVELTPFPLIIIPFLNLKKIKSKMESKLIM